MSALRKKSWSPYVVGLGIGILSWFTFATTNNPLGITTAFENSAALVEKAVAPQAAAQNKLFADKAKDGKTPKIDWEWMVVVGVFIGAYISSKVSGDRSHAPVPGLWEWRFGPSRARRFAGAFIGGAVMMLGARLAQGCTSGHGISGALQLAVSSWIFAPLLFIAAIATAFAMFGREGRNHV